MKDVAAVWWIGTILVLSAESGFSSDQEPKLLRGEQFQREALLPMVASGVEPVPVRSFFRELSSARRVAILLDRRIDPSRKISTNVSAETLEAGLQVIAVRCDADLSRVADTFVIGPADSVRFLRTRINMLREDMKKSPVSLERQVELLREAPISWEDLTSPRELAERIAKKYKITIKNPDEIPHDLWAGGAIANADFLEAVQVVLFQYDESFKWVDESTIEILPEPPIELLTKPYRVEGMTSEEALELIHQSGPDVKAELEERTIKVTGRVEDHELVEELMRTKGPRGRTPRTADPKAMANRRFTLTIEQQPFDAVIEFLRKNGMDVKYDSEKLTDAGIDLKQRISLKLEGGTVEDLFGGICDAMQLTFEIDGGTIRLNVRE